MNRVRWGVLSTAKIGVEKVIPAMLKAESVEVLAIASRSAGNAEKIAQKLGISRAYGSYEALLADPDIDAIYNPLPNHLHVSATIQALAAGKHVLCEKPVALNQAEAKQLLEAARAHPHLKVMEAFMYRHHPQWHQAKAWVDDGAIGPLQTVQSFFSYFNDDPGNIRNQADIGGGSLMDVGCYCVSLARYLFADEPESVLGNLHIHGEFRTDTVASGLMNFKQGSASFTCGTQLAPYQRVNVVGTTGRIEIDIPFNAPADQQTRLSLFNSEGEQQVTVAACDQYTLQAESMSQSILNDTDVLTPLDDAFANMQVIDRLVESSELRAWR